MTQVEASSPSPRIVVVDASVAAKWAVQEAQSDTAISLLADWAAEGVRVIVPAHFAAECASIMYKRVTHKEFTAEEAQQALTAILDVGMVVAQEPLLSVQAIGIAAQYGLASAYDGQYVALAVQYQCELWTADKRLVNALGQRFPLVRRLEDYHAQTQAVPPENPV